MGLSIQTHPDRFEVVPYLDPPDPFVVVRAFENDASASLFLRSADLCDALIAAAAEAKRLLSPPAEPARSHVCECGHYEAYHVGAVRGDDNPGQCTACVTCDTFEAMTATAPAPEAGQ